VERRNRYYARSRISERKFRQLLRYFAMDFSATDVAQLTGIRRKAVTVIFLKIRRRIAQECERASPFSGEAEVDECYFGASSCSRQARARGRRQDSGLRAVEAQWQGLYGDRAGLLEGHFAGHHSRSHCP